MVDTTKLTDEELWAAEGGGLSFEEWLARRAELRRVIVWHSPWASGGHGGTEIISPLRPPEPDR